MLNISTSHRTMEYEKCHLFHPDASRPAKRRRIHPRGLHASWPIRRHAYREAWRAHHDQITSTLNHINSATVSDISQFLLEAHQLSHHSRIPTCLVLGGPHATLQNQITQQLAKLDSRHGPRLFASLSPASSTNLKATLKNLIQSATARVDGIQDEDDELATTQTKGRKLLNYDLQILADFAHERNVGQVVVAFEGTEAFDSALLSELIEILASWRDRIPFVCLFNVATSVDFLQQRLSTAAVKCLDGRLFDVAPSAEVVEQVFSIVTDPSSLLWLGPNLAGMTLERQSDYIQSIDTLVDAVQYAYMSCYYANALSIFLIPNITIKTIPTDHFQALRTLKSFRNHAQEMLQDQQTEQLRNLLDSDEALLSFAQQKIDEGRQNLVQMMIAIDVIRTIQTSLPNVTASSRSNLYVQAMAGTLDESALLRSLLLSVRKAPSDTSIALMRSLVNLNIPKTRLTECKTITTELEQLLQDQTPGAQPLRSADDVKNSTLRTTVVAQKVELSKQKSSLSKQDAAYTALLRRLSDLLERYFDETFIPISQLPFHEIFIYDSKSPHREVLTPRPRHAIERALATPHDYLDCDCCAPDQTNDAALSATQPATAVLYQLYLESGNLINACDLWLAFSAVMGEELEEEMRMALFQRGLAELRFLGLVKGTRKRVDHIAKVAWKGL
ncbi:Hypothetical protein R9X50_00555200 [Acrodontium crateriforme]|uniref:Origin recognition complex subunit 3 n=1 Tax=Acrodontium crateriforme TaxID=150365 RepID=A0AAQ3RAY9_9PEZI|nr:Hypothetical protein R9X50_00555200 [Acrodontium crateriforme]